MKKLLIALLAAVSIAAQAAVTPLDGVTPQRATALSPFATPVAVRVTDTSGKPVAAVAAYFVQSSGVMQVAAGAAGDCWIDFMIALVCKAKTDSEGIARFPAMAASYAASFTARVSATNDRYPDTVRYGETTLAFVADPVGPPATMEVVDGDNQYVAIGTPLAPVTLRLRTSQGQPVTGAPVWYTPPDGPTFEAHTDGIGIAKLTLLTAAWGLGEHEVGLHYFDPVAAVHVLGTLKYTGTNALGGSILELGDLWWGGPAESGWGMSITQRDNRLFNVWFIYDESGKATWFVQPGGEWTGGVGGYYGGNIYRPRSSPWFAYDVSRFAAGTPVVNTWTRFRGPEWGWTSLVNKRIERQVFGGNEPGPMPGVGGLWWGGPSQNGWGVAIHEQGSKLFIVWFTYDADGMPTWFAMPEGTWSDDRTHAGAVYRTSGPPSTQPFDPANVRVSLAGSYSLRFDSTDAARMEMNVDGRSVILELERQTF